MKVSSSVPARRGIPVTDDWEDPHFIKECRMFPRQSDCRDILCRRCIGAGAGAGCGKAWRQNHLSSKSRLSSLHAVKTHGLEAVAVLAKGSDVPCGVFLDEDSLPAGEKPDSER